MNRSQGLIMLNSCRYRRKRNEQVFYISRNASECNPGSVSALTLFTIFMRRSICTFYCVSMRASFVVTANGYCFVFNFDCTGKRSQDTDGGEKAIKSRQRRRKCREFECKRSMAPHCLGRISMALQRGGEFHLTELSEKCSDVLS